MTSHKDLSNQTQHVNCNATLNKILGVVDNVPTKEGDTMKGFFCFFLQRGHEIIHIFIGYSIYLMDILETYPIYIYSQSYFLNNVQTSHQISGA